MRFSSFHSIVNQYLYVPAGYIPYYSWGSPWTVEPAGCYNQTVKDRYPLAQIEEHLIVRQSSVQDSADCQGNPQTSLTSAHQLPTMMQCKTQHEAPEITRNHHGY